ncbi:MAG: DPP IV N-terminal domain-containing protein [Candidatus Eremiobacterota bacterium]
MNKFITVFLIIFIIALSGCQLRPLDIKDIKKQKIAFVSERDGNPEIYVMDENGKNQVRITNNRANEFKPDWSPDGRTIIFASERSGPLNTDIFTVKYTPTGGEKGIEQLTDFNSTDKDPSYSPTGDKIVYISSQENAPNEELFIMNKDGSDKHALTGTATWNRKVDVPWQTMEKDELKTFDLGAWVYNYWPHWSTDGTRIVFYSFGVERANKIYFINPASPAVGSKTVTNIRLESTDDRGNPKGNQVWSTQPKDHWILGVVNEKKQILNPVNEDKPLLVQGITRLELYAADTGWFKEGQNFKITVTYAEGTSEEILTKITKEKAKQTMGTMVLWSGIGGDAVGPGEQIGADKRPDGHFSLIFQLGAIPMKYSPAEWSDKEPSYSPGGDKIVFTSDRDGNEEIYISNPDGSNPVRLTNNPARDFAPSWSPDGKKIAFTTDRDGLYNEEIYVMNIDGSKQINVSNNPTIDRNPAWSPAIKSK